MTTHDIPPRTRFVALIESALEERGWSKQDLAERIHVSRGAVYNWLKGDIPSADMCFHIARALNMNPLRVLEACNYAPGISGLLDLLEQLESHQQQLLDLRAGLQSDRLRSRLGLVVNEFAKSGLFSFTVTPCWRGTSGNRRHFADLVVLDPDEQHMALNQESIEERFGDVISLAMSWWEGEENWGNVLQGPRRPKRGDLVLNVPRFVANRRAGDRTEFRAPQSIVLIGGHWCGQAEAGRFLAETLDYDYALPSLAASVMHKTLVQRWNEPSWDRDRLDLVRTFALSTPISRRRVWAVDYWDDADGVRIVTNAPQVPYVIFLDPSDALLEYAAARRSQDGHGRDGRSRSDDLKVMRRVREEARGHLASIRKDELLVLPVGVIDNAWSDYGDSKIALPLVDEWFDHFATTAQRIYDKLLGKVN
jgi:transcriptional regulator with XRE-family HTH domain